MLQQMEKCLKRCQVYLWKHEIEFKRCAWPIWNVNAQNRKCILLPIYFIAVSAAQSWRILPLRNYLFSNFWTRTSWPSALTLLAARFPTTNMCLVVIQMGSTEVSGKNIWTLIVCTESFFLNVSGDVSNELNQRTQDDTNLKIAVRIMEEFLNFLIHLKIPNTQYSVITI